MAAIAAWLGKIALGVLLEKLRTWLFSAIAKQKQQAADHQSAVSRANDDAKKVEALKPGSPGKDVDDAIDGELNHI